MSLERGQSIPGAEERENEVERVSFDYKDEEGKVLGRAELLFGPGTKVSDYLALDKSGSNVCREVTSFKIMGDKGEADVFELANDGGMKVFAATERLQNYNSKDDLGFVTCPPLSESSVAAGVLLHELGHAQQPKDDEYKELRKLYGLLFNPGVIFRRFVEFRTLLARVIEIIPEAKEFIDFEKLNKIKSLRKDYKELEEGREHIEEKISRFAIDKNSVEMEFIRGHLLNNIKLDELSRAASSASVELKGLTLESDQYKKVKEARKKEILDKMRENGFVIDKIAENEDKNGKLSGEDLSLEDMEGLFVSLPTNLKKAKYKDVKRDGDYFLFNLEYPFEIGGKTYTVELNAKAKKDAYNKYSKNITGIIKEAKSEEEEKTKLEIAMEKLEERIVKLLRESEIDKIIYLPKKICERDATYRALRWIKKIRDKTGFDLLKAVDPKGKDFFMAEGGDCVDSVQKAIKSEGGNFQEGAGLLVFFREALAGYKAENKEFRLKGKRNKLGVMPVPGVRKKTKPSS